MKLYVIYNSSPQWCLCVCFFCFNKPLRLTAIHIHVTVFLITPCLFIACKAWHANLHEVQNWHKKIINQAQSIPIQEQSKHGYFDNFSIILLPFLANALCTVQSFSDSINELS